MIGECSLQNKTIIATSRRVSLLGGLEKCGYNLYVRHMPVVSAAIQPIRATLFLLLVVQRRAEAVLSAS